MESSSKTNSAPGVEAPHPGLEVCRGDDNRFGIPFHGSNGWEGLPAEDGVGCQDAAFPQPEAVERDLAAVLGDLVDAHHSREQQGDAIHAVTLHKYILPGGDVHEVRRMPEDLCELRVGLPQDGQAGGDAIEICLFDHMGQAAFSTTQKCERPKNFSGVLSRNCSMPRSSFPNAPNRAMMLSYAPKMIVRSNRFHRQPFE